MKEFDLEKAKAGAKVCTRDGREVRIVCFDRKSTYPIVALVRNNDGEKVQLHLLNGTYLNSGVIHHSDLMLAGEKKEGWVNVYGNGCCGKVYTTREEAIKGMIGMECVDTIHIEWEE